MYTPSRVTPFSSHSTAIRWAAFSDDSPNSAGQNRYGGYSGALYSIFNSWAESDPATAVSQECSPAHIRFLIEDAQRDIALLSDELARRDRHD